MIPLPARSFRPSLSVALVALMVCAPALAQAPVAERDPPNRPDIAPAFAAQTEAPEQVLDVPVEVTEIADGLDRPWGIAVLPGAAGYLVTERVGTLRHVGRDGAVSAPISGVPEVFAVAQGGLLDVEIDPGFADNRLIYLTYSKPVGMTQSATAVLRARLSEDLRALTDGVEIFEQTPASRFPIHFGSRVIPAADGTVWISTGDRGATERVQRRAQDPATTYGGVMRVTGDGTPAGDSGLAGAAPERVTLGQRNIQGMAVQPGTGALWTVEHGPAGGDELNLIVPGANYGWPVVSYGENYNGSEIGDGRTAHGPEFVEPRYYWDPVIAPGGMIFYDPPADAVMFPEWQGDLFIAGLQARAVVRLDIEGDTVLGEERLAPRNGRRVRDVAVDHDGAILFLTDREDGAVMRIARP